MSEYILPSGIAKIEMEGGLLSTREYTLPLKRKDLEEALKEALDELWNQQTTTGG